LVRSIFSPTTPCQKNNRYWKL